MSHEEALPDPRFFISTAAQRQEAAAAAATEPQQVAPRVWLGSRACVVHQRERLQQLAIAHVLQCADRAPDAPRAFAYRVVECNNEARDAGEQHARHSHDDDGQCCAAATGTCRELHLLQWTPEGAPGSCVADELSEWIASRAGNVLVVGYDGVSNSAAVVTAYLMRQHGMRFADAWQQVKRARPVVRLTPALRRDLMTYDTRLASRHVGRIVPKRGEPTRKSKKKQHADE